MNDKINQYDSIQLYENRVQLFEDLIEEWNLLSGEQRQKQEKKVAALHHKSRSQQPQIEQDLKKRESMIIQIQTSRQQQQEDEKEEDSVNDELLSCVVNARKSRFENLPSPQQSQQSQQQIISSSEKKPKKPKKTQKQKKEVTSPPAKRRLPHTKGQKQKEPAPFCIQNLNHSDNFILDILDKLEKK